MSGEWISYTTIQESSPLATLKDRSQNSDWRKKVEEKRDADIVDSTRPSRSLSAEIARKLSIMA